MVGPGLGPASITGAAIGDAASDRWDDRDKLSSVFRRTGTQATPRSRRASRCAMVASSSFGYKSDMGVARQASGIATALPSAVDPEA